MVYILPFVSVVLGCVFAFLFGASNPKLLKLLLAFSGAFLLTITLTHLLPDIYAYQLEQELATHTEEIHSHLHNHEIFKSIGLFVMLGIVFQIILEFFSKGAEHGHVHQGKHSKKLPISLFLSLCLHALFEGLPIGHHHQLALGISIHHLPIAMILTLFFMESHLKRSFIVLFMLLFATMTPLGTFLSEFLPFLNKYYTEISAIVVGILFHISSTIIFESNEQHRFNVSKLAAIFIGIALGFLV